jgi:hypothetical protein
MIEEKPTTTRSIAQKNYIRMFFNPNDKNHWYKQCFHDDQSPKMSSWPCHIPSMAIHGSYHANANCWTL